MIIVVTYRRVVGPTTVVVVLSVHPTEECAAALKVRVIPFVVCGGTSERRSEPATECHSAELNAADCFIEDL